MNIVLLSGGFGKRLWPLSNDIKSKQFIRFFKRDDGTYESMLERVYRQIKGADRSARITIATSEVQVPFISEQLGDNVSISIEPARRDTFPAIVLSSLFLYEKLGIGLDEPVIVSPVDPYVDEAYYTSFKELETIVNEGTASLTLMGITPTYPSEKYGYIIPEDNKKISKVRTFKEKPDEKTAGGYIASGALWNAGVFAFKLGYLLDIAHKLIDFKGYEDLYEDYQYLEKISFDYAVVEKEENIDVLRYTGRWEDVGTWNTICDVLDENIIGNVVADDTSRNLSAINELAIPILCMGCKDMIVVASEDGILVSDKERSSSIKTFVDKLPTADVEKGLSLVNRDEFSSLYRIKLEKDKIFSSCSKAEIIMINTVRGSGNIVIDGRQTPLTPGDSISVLNGQKYEISSSSDFEAVIIVLEAEKIPLKEGE